MNFKEWLIINEGPSFETLLKKAKIRIEEIAQFYRDEGRLPSTSKKSPDPNENRLGASLSRFRIAASGVKGVFWNEELAQYGISLGLPKDWWKTRDLLQDAKQKIEEIAQFYRDEGRLPSKTFTDPNEKRLGASLSRFRIAASGVKGVWNEELAQYGISLGLPKDWWKTRDLLQDAKQRIEEIAQFYRDEGRLPSKTQKSPDPNEKRLGNYLHGFRYAASGVKGVFWNQELAQYGISLGLPKDWWKTRDLLQDAKQKIEEIAQFYRDEGRLPSTSKKSPDPNENRLGASLSRFREAASGVKGVFWNEELAQYGISLGLPKDWWKTNVIFTKSRLSIGETFLEKALLKLLENENNFKATTTQVCPRNAGQCLRYDAAILDENNQPVAAFETHGEQHYYPVARFGNLQKFIKGVELDKEKIKITNFPILTIPYWDYANLESNVIRFWNEIKANKFSAQPVWAVKLSIPKGKVIEQINKKFTYYIKKYPRDPYIIDPNLITDIEIRNKIIKLKKEIESESNMISNV